MAEPSTNRVDVDTGAKQRTRARVPHHMRGDLPPDQCRHTSRTALDKPIHPEPRIGPSVPAEKDGIAISPSLDQLRKPTFGTRPQWTLTQLPALAVEGDECMSAVASCDLQVLYLQFRRFRDARPAVVETISRAR